MFMDQNIPVWDADKNVHKIYKKDGTGYKALTAKFPNLINNVAIDRNQLSKMIQKKETTLDDIESIVHPLLSLERDKFINKYRSYSLVAFDIPLLFETKADTWLDAVLLVNCSKQTQRKRLLKRKNLNERKIKILVSRQNLYMEKRNKSHFFIDSDKNLNEMKKDVLLIIKIIKEKYFVQRSGS